MSDQLPINIQVDNLDNIIKYLPIDILRGDLGFRTLIENQTFEDCKITGVEFLYITFKDCRFIKCDILYSFLERTIFDNCSFVNTYINYSSIESTSFIKCNGSLVIKNCQLRLTAFCECDLSEFYFRRLILNGCEILDSTRLNWDCPELIVETIYQENIAFTQQMKDLLAIIESSGRCHDSLMKFQHPARKQIFQILSKYIKNENDLDVPQYLKDELILIEKEATSNLNNFS